jgi:cellulose synthase/poly-beta-1,6-N-acetylglucosamine synthase-like glycosyltransferase
MSFILIVFYIIAFLAIYVQVFLLVTFFERRKDIVIRKEDINLSHYPTVTIIVPCYNEEATVRRTIDSLLSIHYPKDKLHISLVDNMSKDKTFEILKSYSSHPQIKIFQEPNPGKHNALNCALREADTEFVGCLDSDSSVHPEALKRIITYFDNPLTMAVAPSIIVRDPKNILEYAQRAEYDMAHYTKKMLAFLEGIHVTPGPFSIFRKKVFDDLGEYRKAHHTEDQEIALRMHKYGYAIDHCPDAYVYTGGQKTVPRLYRQRVRWIYGFIQNARDYKELIFRPKYGAIGMFTLPSGIISVSATVLLLTFTISRLYSFLASKFIQVNTVGFGSLARSNFSIDLFFVDTRAFLFVTIILYILIISALLKGRSMIYGRKAWSWDILLFVLIYTVVAPLWVIKSVWNAIWSKEASWTRERDYGVV